VEVRKIVDMSSCRLLCWVVLHYLRVSFMAGACFQAPFVN